MIRTQKSLFGFASEDTFQHSGEINAAFAIFRAAEKLAGKTLNINSTGVSINVSLGQGVGYSKRLITWKKLNLLSIFGLGKKADEETTDEETTDEEEKTTKKKSTRRSKKTSSRKTKKDTAVPTLDEAIAQAEAEEAES